MKGLEVIQHSRDQRFIFAVETSPDAQDYEKYEDLRFLIWEDAEDNFAGPRNMASENYFYDGSSLFIGVYTENDQGGFTKDKAHLVAFAYGYVGVKDKEIAFRDPQNLIFYSQYAAVHPDFQDYGLGIRLKQFQKDKVQNILGVDIITCTFDPLAGVNAYRNIHVLGMNILAYKEACYQGFSGLLNRIDVPSDRFLVSWDLNKNVTPAEYNLEELVNSDAGVVLSEWKEIKGKNKKLEFPLVTGLSLDKDNEYLLIEIPYDFYAMLQETDVTAPNVRNIPVEWRQKTRQAFLTLFAAGYKIVDFRYLQQGKRKRDFYILQRT